MKVGMRNEGMYESIIRGGRKKADEEREVYEKATEVCVGRQNNIEG